MHPCTTHIGYTACLILNSSNSRYLKKVAVADFSGICANTTFVFESKDHSIFDQRLLPFIMLSDSFTSWSISKSKGSTNPYVLFSDLADYEFDLPSLEEQKVLADKLWAAYRLKEGYKKLLCVTDEMVKSQFIEMLFKKPITGKVGDLVDKKIFSVKKIHSMNDIIEYIDISSVERSNHSIVETTSYVVSNAPSRAQQCVRLDDILVSTVRPINRNIAVVNSDKNNLVASTGFCVLRPKLAFKEYLLAIVQSDKYTEAMIDKASGGLYPAVNNGDVLNYGIYIPDEEFAKKFSLIYQQADKSKFGDFKSQFIEMFRDCVNRIKLSSLCSTFVDGDWIESKDQSELGIRLIQTGNVGNGFFKDKEDKSRYISEETFDNLHCTEIYPGDILVSRLPDPIGRACIIPQGLGRTITAVDCTIIRLKDIILPDYFIAYTMTPSYAAQINEVTTGTTRRRVSRANLGNILIPCPSIAKQQQFVAIAKQADKSKFELRKSIDAIDQVIKSLING